VIIAGPDVIPAVTTPVELPIVNIELVVLQIPVPVPLNVVDVPVQSPVAPVITGAVFTVIAFVIEQLPVV